MELQSSHGKRRVLAFRKLGDVQAGAKLAFQTEHKWEYERKSDNKATKDGNIASGGSLEVKLSINGIASNDPTNKLLADSVKEGFELEVWDIDLDGAKQGNKYPAKYARGTLNKWEIPAKADELVEISSEMSISGQPVDGYTALTFEQEQEAMYVFQEMTAKTASSGKQD